MILPAGVQQSITKNNIDISTGWMFASFPIWNLDYSAPLAQPVSMAAVPLADLRFLDPTVTLVIRQSASPTSLVLWSGVAVMDDDSGSASVAHNDLPGRSEGDAHPMAAISGFATAQQGGLGRSFNQIFGTLRGSLLGGVAGVVDGKDLAADSGAVTLGIAAEVAPYREAASGTTYTLTGEPHHGFEWVIYGDTVTGFNIDATVYPNAVLNGVQIDGQTVNIKGQSFITYQFGRWFIMAGYSASSLPGGPYQPLDSDLTAIAALATTAFGRSLLTQADAAAARATIGALAASLKGSVNGVAELDATGRVPAAQLPSSLALGETSATAYRGDRGKTAYDHSQATGNPHGTTASQVGAQPLEDQRLSTTNEPKFRSIEFHNPSGTANKRRIQMWYSMDRMHLWSLADAASGGIARTMVSFIPTDSGGVPGVIQVDCTLHQFGTSSIFKLDSLGGAGTRNVLATDEGRLIPGPDVLLASLKGAAYGVAELDSAGKVPASQLPAYVDSIVEVADFAALPGTGASGTIYVTLSDGKTFRWSGSSYVEISSSLALGETASSAYRGDRGKTAYDHSQVTASNPHATTFAQLNSIPAAIDAIDGLTPAADRLAYYTGTNSAALAVLTSFARTLLDDVDAAAARATLGAQPLDSDLTAIAALVTTPYGRALLTLADAAAARVAVGLSPTDSPEFANPTVTRLVRRTSPTTAAVVIDIDGTVNAVNQVVYGDQEVQGSARFSALSGGGTVVADASGNIGIAPVTPLATLTDTRAMADALVMVDSTHVSVASVLLTPGDWLVSGVVTQIVPYGCNSGALGVALNTAITVPSDGTEAYDAPTFAPALQPSHARSANPATRIYKVTADTTVHLVAVSNWGGSAPSVFGSIEAVKIAAPIASAPGTSVPLEVGTDGDMVYTHPTGQKLFNGNFLYSWTYQGGGDYSNLTVDSTTETTVFDQTTAGRNGIFPILSPGYLLGKGPIWVRVRGGYGVIGANPVLTVRVYMGATVIGIKRIDLSTFTRTTENMGFGLLFWIEPINALSPGTSLRLRTHHYGQVSQGLADAAGSFLLSEDETYSNIDGTAAQNLKVTAQWSGLGSQTWAFFDGIEVYR